MKRKNVIVASILTLTVLASSSAMAFADTDTTTAGNAAAKDLRHRGDIRAELNLTDAQKTLIHEARVSALKEALANLVSAGTITQAEANTIISNMPTEPADRGDGPFQNLTETQKTALKAKLNSLRPADWDKNSCATYEGRVAIMTKAITALVKEGVLTQTEADTIISNMPEERADRGDGPFQSLTEEQKTALLSELQILRASSIKELVSDGTITQAQADLLLKQGPGKMGGHGKGSGPRP